MDDFQYSEKVLSEKCDKLLCSYNISLLNVLFNFLSKESKIIIFHPIIYCLLGIRITLKTYLPCFTNIIKTTLFSYYNLFLHQSKENTITKFNVWSKIIPSWMNPKNTSFVWWCSITRQSISPMWWGVTWLQITSKFMAQIQ